MASERSTGRAVIGVSALALIGLLAVLAVVLFGVRAGVGPAVRLPDWPGPWPPVSDRADRGRLAIGAAVAVGVLVAVWWQLGGRTEAGGLGLPAIAAIVSVWSVPLVLAPPLLSLDVFSYAALGRMADFGLNPYGTGPSVLGQTPFLLAVDPLWRHTPSPYGPVMLQVLHAVAELSGSRLVLAVALLRVIAALAVIAAIILAVRAAGPASRSSVLVLAALNPLVLLHLVSGAHLDAMVGALAVAVVCVTVRGHRQAGLALAVIAGLIKAPGLVLVVFVLMYTARAWTGGRWRGFAGLTVTGLATVTTAYLLLPDAFGWVSALGTSGRVRTWYVPSSLVSSVIGTVLDGVGAGVSAPTVLALGRAITMLAGATIALVLIWRATRGGVRTALCGVGWALVTVALTGPTLYAWYLGWGVFAAAAGSRPRGRRALLLICGLLSFTSMPDLRSATPVALLSAAAFLVLILYRSRPTQIRPAPIAAAHRE